jgi:hypothetical protein
LYPTAAAAAAARKGSEKERLTCLIRHSETWMLCPWQRDAVTSPRKE